MTSIDIAGNSISFCHAQGLQGSGPLNADVMVVGVAPAREEMRTKKYYSGETGKLTQSVFRALDLDWNSCYVTNLCCSWIKEPTMDDVQHCMQRLLKEVLTVKPKVILALGALPIQFFTGRKDTKRVRGSCIWNDDFNCWIVTSWQPTVVLTVSPGLIADVVRDFRKIDYIKDKPKTLGDVSWTLIDHPVQAQEMLDSEWLREAQFPSLDVECKWDPVNLVWTDDIRCLSISDGDKTVVFPEEVLAGLRWPVDGSVHWTFHNAMFDTQKMIVDQCVELPIGEDTMLMSYSLDERGGSDDEAAGVDIAVGIHGLKRISREYCGAGFYEVNLKTAPDNVVWAYNAKDAAYTSRLAKLFYERQLEEGVRRVYEEMILPEVRLCRDEKAHGVYILRDRLDGVAVTWIEEWLATDKELETEAYKYGWPEPNFNWNSPPQTLRLLNNYLDIHVTDTQAPTLEPYFGHPWVGKRARVKKIDKQLGTYVKPVIKMLEHDTRVHPDASLHATVSGRKSYHNPPVGVIPTGSQYMDPDEEPDEETQAEIAEFKQVRGMFGAPPGKVWIEADKSAAELWTAAGITGDAVMLADLFSGDFHSNAAESMFHCKRDDYSEAHWSGMRRNSKYVTFGVLFWREAPSLFSPKPGQGGNLGKQYTLREIQQMVIAWHQRYHVHAEWSDRETADAKRTGEQHSLSGRRRQYYAPGVYKNFKNMAANWPIQTTSHDHLIVDRLEIDALYRQGKFPARTLFDGHDAIYFECDGGWVVDPKNPKRVIPTGVAAEVVPMIKEIMERPRWFDFGIPVEIKVGQNWAEGKVVSL